MIIDKIKKTTEYFEYFSNKNLHELSLMFHDSIELTDWSLSAKGKELVLLENKKIFDNFNTISIQVQALTQNDDTVMAHINITLNEDIHLNVVDILKFNGEKIISVNAFKQ